MRRQTGAPLKASWPTFSQTSRTLAVAPVSVTGCSAVATMTPFTTLHTSMDFCQETSAAGLIERARESLLKYPSYEHTHAQDTHTHTHTQLEKNTQGGIISPTHVPEVVVNAAWNH